MPLENPEDCLVKIGDEKTLNDENLELITQEIRFKKGKLSTDLCTYLRNVMDKNYDGAQKSRISLTRPVVPEFEMMILKAYETILTSLKADRFEGLRSDVLEAEVETARDSREKFIKTHLLGHFEILES